MAWPDTDVGQFAQLQLQGTLFNGQAFRNSYHVWGHDSASPMGVDDINGFLASAWMDDLVAAYKALIGSNSTLDGVLVRQVHDPLNPGDVKNEGFRSDGGAGTGTPGTTVATEMCPMLKLGSDAAGRSAHGRVFLPWNYDRDEITGENFLATGAPATKIADLIGVLQDLFYTAGAGHAAGAAADFDLAIYSNTLRARSADQYGFRVTSAQWKRKIHWLRSRNPN